MQIKFTGMTPLGSSLDSKVIRPILGAGIHSCNLEKPILVIAITDGEPTAEPQNIILDVIKNAKSICANSVYGPGAIAFEFAQVGKDINAQAFLATLATDSEVGKMVDATASYELQAWECNKRGMNLTPELWLVMLMVGAIDRTYDNEVSTAAYMHRHLHISLTTFTAVLATSALVCSYQACLMAIRGAMSSVVHNSIT